MEYASPIDFFKVRLESILSDSDKEFLTILYQPLIGYGALSLFLTLKELAGLEESEPKAHDYLFLIMQITSPQFHQARAALEAVGLMKTYIFKHNDINQFTYCLFSPKTPSDFFNDNLFKGLLNSYVGEKISRQIESSYALAPLPNDFKEVTSSFGEVFHPNFENPAYLFKPMDGLKKRQAGQTMSDFDPASFLKEISSKGTLKPDLFTKETIEEISRIANLFGLDEMAMAELIPLSMSPNFSGIDFVKLARLAGDEVKMPFVKNRRQMKKSNMTGISSKAEKVRLMESMSCKDYLRIKQNNTQPTPPDLALVNELSKTTQLSIPVINALIDYVLEVQNNTLSRSYTLKIAGSLAREGVNSAIDAMDYLRKVHNYVNKNKSLTKTVSQKPLEANSIPETDIDAILASFEEEKKKNNGKN